jgi:hypothetical protein
MFCLSNDFFGLHLKSYKETKKQVQGEKTPIFEKKNLKKFSEV